MTITRADLADLPPTLTVEHAAVLLGVGRRTAYRAVNDGTLPHLRLGKRIVIPTDRLLREVLGHLPEETTMTDAPTTSVSTLPVRGP